MDWDKLRKQLADGVRISDEDISGLADAFAEARRVISKLRSARYARQTAAATDEETATLFAEIFAFDQTAPESSERLMATEAILSALLSLFQGRALVNGVDGEFETAIGFMLEEAIISIEDAKEEGATFDDVLRRLRTMQLIAESKPGEDEASARLVQEWDEPVTVGADTQVFGAADADVPSGPEGATGDVEAEEGKPADEE